MTQSNRITMKADKTINSFLRLVFCLLVSVASTFTAHAQNGAEPAFQPDRGTSTPGTYSIADIENINLTNGNLNLTIPLASLPPIGGGKLSWTINAGYNSKLYDLKSDQYDSDFYHLEPYSIKRIVRNTTGASNGGWIIGGTYQVELQTSDAEVATVGCVGDPECFYASFRFKYFLVTPDGARHELRPLDARLYTGPYTWRIGYYSQTPENTGTAMRYYSYDGSHLYAIIYPPGSATKWTVYMKDGSRVSMDSSGIERMYDTNGNSIAIYSEVDGEGLTTTHFVDELTGREIKVTKAAGPGLTQVHYQAVGGTWMTIDINWGTASVFGLAYNLGDRFCSKVSSSHADTFPVVRSIVLPQTEPGLPRRQFTFSYNSDTADEVNYQYTPGCEQPQVTVTSSSHGWGELSRMITPTGAQIDYSYTLDGIPNVTSNLRAAEEVPRASISQKKITHDGGTEDTWTYTIQDTGGRVDAPDGSSTIESFFPHDPAKAGTLVGIDGKGGLVFRSDRSNKIRVERQWGFRIFNGANADSPEGKVGFNTVVEAEYTSLMEGGNPVKMSAKTFQYDFNGNLTQTTEYDWFDPALVTRDGNGVPTGVPNGATVLRTTTTSYYNPATGAGSANVYAKRPLDTVTPLILSAQQETITGPSKTRFSYDGQEYSTAPTAGNLTKFSIWDSTNNKWIDTGYSYDSYGNRSSATAPNGSSSYAGGAVTSYFYDDGTHALPTGIVVDPLNGTGEQTTTIEYDYSTGRVTSQTDPNGNTTTTDYTNQLLGSVDPFMRPGLITGPAVTSVVGGVTYNDQHRKVKTTYQDNLRRVTVESDLNTEGDYKLKSRTTQDQLGRTVLTESNENGTGNYTISAQTVYEQMGKITFASQPKRSAGANTDGWTRTTRDESGRIIEVAHFSGASQPPTNGANGDWTGSVTTAYYANQTTVTDQAGKARSSLVDGLGRLVQVNEDPGALGYQTSYSYDSRNNLTTVSQGSQTRSFNYNSLNRMTSATNPESGTVSYLYYDNGNLKQKTDARSITISYTYDGLNRNTTVDYSNTTINPDINRYYDGATNGKGRFHYDYAGGNLSDGNEVESRAVDSYDAMGRPLNQRQHFRTDGGPLSEAYAVGRTYNLAGNVTSQTYPSGHKADYSYDNVGRLSQYSGNLGDGVPRTYANNFLYTATGLMQRERFGTQTALYHRRHYTSRGQMFDVRLGSDSNSINDGDDPNQWTNGSWNRGGLRFYYSSNWVYGNGGENINGNVWRQDIFIPNDSDAGSWVLPVIYYNYDGANRIKSAIEQTFSSDGGAPIVYEQHFNYDQYGNRTIDPESTQGPINNRSYKIVAATNQLKAPTDTDNDNSNNKIRYDAAGNQIKDTYTQSGTTGTRTYDAENRMLTADGTNGLSNRYVYDPDGRRTRRVINAGQPQQETWWQIYGMDGELIAEYPAGTPAATPSKEYGYRSGELLVVAGCDVARWLVADHLGTPRIEVDVTGSYSGIKRHDYLPFGEELGDGVGGRSASNGYSADCVRQRYDKYERDNETGLDFAQARYFSSLQGRFTSPDEFIGGPRESVMLGSGNPEKQALPYAEITNPQSINKYQFCYNNPLRYIDPDGHDPDGDGWLDQIGKFIRVAANALGLGHPEIEDRDAEVINNNRLPDGRKFGDAMKNDIIPAMKQTGETLQKFNELIDPTGGVAATAMGVAAGSRDNKDLTIAAIGSVVANLGPFGKSGTAIAREAVNVVKQAGTHEAIEVAGKAIIPTRQVAEKLIAAAGGTIDRVERAHRGVGHPYPHINYTTARGEKATIRVQSVGRQFFRRARKQVEE